MTRIALLATLSVTLAGAAYAGTDRTTEQFFTVEIDEGPVASIGGNQSLSVGTSQTRTIATRK